MSLVIRIRQHGGPEVLAAIDETLPPPAPGEVRIRHTTIGLNFIDTYFRAGIYRAPLPHGLGQEAAGVITEIEASIGQRVNSADALVHIARTDKLWLDIQIPASNGAHWQPGTAVKVQGREITGQVLSSSAMVASGSQTLLLRAQLDGKPGDLRPGEFVTVDLPVNATTGGWDLPLVAVAHDGALAVVFVRTADGFEARPVTVLASAGQRVRVQGTLDAGDAVAVSGVVALKGAWLKDQGAE